MAAGGNADGEGEALAQWLKEAGRRAQRAAPNPEDGGDSYNAPASLHHYLEDLAGNRIGRAFEVDQFERADRSAEPDEVAIPFRIAQ